MALYAIVRHYFDPPSGILRRVIATGLDLEQAQAWCADPETSSKTCTKPHNRRRTKKLGPWFDGYTDNW